MEPVRPRKSVLGSFRHARDGVLFVLRTQRHMQFHFVLMVVVLVAALGLEVTRMEMVALFFAIALVLITEMVNTALEIAVDLGSRAYHPIARVAKDVAAGAVLIASVNSLLVAAVVFGTNAKLRATVSHAHFYPHSGTGYVLVGGAVLVLIAVVVLKVRAGRGSLLRGGAVSGHSALGFFLATSICFLTGSFPVTLLATALALLVSESRVEADIHSATEVVLGAAVGTAATFLVFLVPRLLAGWVL
jgi:diacylglycerol kinase (ATP)